MLKNLSQKSSHIHLSLSAHLTTKRSPTNTLMGAIEEEINKVIFGVFNTACIRIIHQVQMILNFSLSLLAPALPTNITLGWNGLTGTNSLAYCDFL
jgi:hypothetical protein